MNGGRYRIQVAITTHLPVVADEATLRSLMARLSIYLPPGAEACEIHADPPTHEFEFVATITAGSPGDALQILRAAMEYLRENVRKEHGLPPIGEEAELRRACLTYANDPEHDS